MTPERARLAGSFALGALLVLFAVLNLDDVEVNWIVATWQTPLIVVIVVSMAVGMALAFGISRYRSARSTPPKPPKRGVQR